MKFTILVTLAGLAVASGTVCFPDDCRNADCTLAPTSASDCKPPTVYKDDGGPCGCCAGCVSTELPQIPQLCGSVGGECVSAPQRCPTFEEATDCKKDQKCCIWMV